MAAVSVALVALASPGLLACWLAPPLQRRRLLQSASVVGPWFILSSPLGSPSRGKVDEDAEDADELYGELPGTSAGDECSCCQRDWCCKGDCVDCYAFLKAKGYALPITASRAYSKGGKAGWSAQLNLQQPTLRSLPKWFPTSSSSLKVKNSTIEGAGQGLFAASALRAGSVLPAYQGEMLSFAEGKARIGSPYLWCPVFSYAAIVGDGNWSTGEQGEDLSACVDAAGQSSAKGNPVRYINGAASPEQCKRVNVEMCELGQVLYFRTTKTVAASAEFVADYGPEYWNGFRC